MRAHHAIAVVTVFLVGFGLRLTFFPTRSAEADVGTVKSVNIESVNIDISQMHRNIKNLPAEKFHDMSFVFSDSD